ncbi:multi-component regulatory system-6 [Alloactinosynnema sp. L-07]|uniref:DUF742 domain-containing protein n=1 Tax=Alloactinosynnema sp. L-07 TaxID=1653480 RepID=UPI00065F024F|nr:DUF742 domain-containing protein [Alloactinosynnema sp. L-07]CRK61900.1 multi-component regulatory system-6 [Alloactinosynnema sp. L-07]
MAQHTSAGRRRRRAEVGRTGARFGPSGAWRDESDPVEVDPVFEAPDENSAIGVTGARFGGAYARPEDDAEYEIAPLPPQLPAPQPDERELAEWARRPESHAMVRPYAWTGGRTRAATPLAIEALVRSTGLAPAWEHRPLAELCASPRSVAEVAALLSLPLGVARVLISDLAQQGVLVVDRTVGVAPDLMMLNRVLAGLQRL